MKSIRSAEPAPADAVKGELSRKVRTRAEQS